jgi:hypothetical protein
MALSFDIKNDRQLQLALGATLVLLIVVLGIFFNNFAYVEAGTEYYFVGSMVGLGLLFWGLRSFKLMVLVPAVLIILVCLGMSIMKFNWREAYLAKADAGNPFLFEEYIESYPSFEEYVFASFTGGPNWITFSRDCAEPVQRSQPPAAECSDLKAIQATYGLDMKKIVNDHFQKMKKTAIRISKGQLKDKVRYEQCIKLGQCVVVPMLPANVNPAVLQTGEYNEIRKAFWALVDENKLNEDVCDQMLLCSTLVQTGALRLSSF